MHQSVQQHHLCMAVADAFPPFTCIWKIAALDAIVIASIDIMKEASTMPGGVVEW
jgi:hypothetical protein